MNHPGPFLDVQAFQYGYFRQDECKELVAGVKYDRCPHAKRISNSTLKLQILILNK